MRLAFISAALTWSVFSLVAATPATASAAPVYLERYGLSPSRADAAANCAKIEQAAAAAAAARVAVVGYRGVVPVDCEIAWPKDTDFDARGLTLTAAGMTSGRYPNLAVFLLKGSYADLGGVRDRSISPGATGLTLDKTPAGLAAGDIVYVVDKTPGSFNPSRPYYYTGEQFVVRSVSGNVVRFDKGFRYAYPSTDMKNVVATKVMWATATIRNLAVIGPSKANDPVGLVAPVYLQLGGPRAALVGVSGSNTANAGIAVWGSVGSQVLNSTGDSRGSAVAAGNNYGLSVANSIGVRVTGGTYFGARHAVAIGGGGGATPSLYVVNYDVVVAKARLIHEAFASNNPAADTHGNCDRCAYLDNEIDGGVQVSGVNSIIKRNTIRAGTALGHFQGCFLVVADIIGYDHDISGNTCSVRGNTNYALFADLAAYNGGFDHVTRSGTLRFRDNRVTFYVTAGATRSVKLIAGFAAASASPAGKPNVEFSNNTFVREGSDSGYTATEAVLGHRPGDTGWGIVDVSNTHGDVAWTVAGAQAVRGRK